jgi:hypothetical protein
MRDPPVERDDDAALLPGRLRQPLLSVVLLLRVWNNRLLDVFVLFQALLTPPLQRAARGFFTAGQVGVEFTVSILEHLGGVEKEEGDD